MKKVLQRVVSASKGDCARAVLASLFEVDLEQIDPETATPATPAKQVKAIRKVFEGHGYAGWFPSGRWQYRKNLRTIMKMDGGVNGYFYVVVPSQTLEGVSHAVVIDKHGNIVHDPNPNQKALKLTWRDLTMIYTTQRIIFTKEGEFMYLADYEKQRDAE